MESIALSQELGKYRLVATLGQGGMGTVYLALASGLGQFRKLLVVKELRQDLTRQKGFVSMFMDEAKLAARLAHPNVVHTFEASQENNRYFLAMEYLDGQSLSALVERLTQSQVKPQSDGQAQGLTLPMHLHILCEVLSGLHYAHELPDYDGSLLRVVHRDVSPQNVFVTYQGEVKVVDFGVAKATNAGERTAPGVFVGKFAYAAPEQVLGRPVDARTDVFAVGVMLWQAIAGRRFSELTPTPGAFRARTDGTEPRIAEAVPTVDPVLARICDRALAVDPEQRYASAQEFRAELKSYLQALGVRVEAAEIGQLMCEVFTNERRALHARIEQAMKQTGASHSSHEALAPFRPEDKEPTALADLSSLIDVSIERDDHKIQQGYANSKITLLRVPSDRPSGAITPFDLTPRRLPMIALMALATVGAAALLIMLFGDRNPAMVKAEPHITATRMAPLTEAPTASPAKLAAARAPAPEPKPKAPPVQLSFVPKPQPMAAPVPERRVEPRRDPQPTAAGAPRNRNHVPPVRVRPSGRDVAEPAAPSREPEQVATPRASAPVIQEGMDLRPARRAAGSRIDLENPYR